MGADKPRNSGKKRKLVQKRSRETRAKILQAAKELFGGRGYEETTTTLIAEKSGVSIGSIYAHFEDKREMFLEIIEEHLQKSLPMLKESVDIAQMENRVGKDVIESLLRQSYELYRNEGNLNFEIMKFRLKDEEAGDVVAYWYGKYREELIRYLKTLRTTNNIKDVEAAAIVITRTAHEILQCIHMDREKKGKEEILSEYAAMLNSYIFD